MAKPDAKRLAAWERFLRAHRVLLDVLEEELKAGRGLPLGWYDVLVQLARAPEGRLRMAELAASVMLTPSGLTRLADRMQEAGLVERQRCSEDRRGWFVVLTPQGRERLRRAAPLHLSGVERHFGRHLSDEEAEVLARALDRVVEAAEGDGAKYL